LIKDAKSYHYHKEKLSDLELLLELQHYGAATGLVDFSRDFLIALWFAAHGNKGVIDVAYQGAKIATLKPEKRQYVTGMPMTEAAIDPSLFRDLYASLTQPLCQ
jgi:hypothetical protein